MKSGLVFIFTHIDFDGDLPLEIIQGHLFRRAKANEVELIKQQLMRVVYPRIGWQIAYEHIVKEERSDNRVSYYHEQLPQEKWKYFVIAFNGYNSEIANLEYSTQLIENDLDFGFQLFFKEENQDGEFAGNMTMPMHLVERYNSPEEANLNAVNIRENELKAVSRIYENINKLPKKYTFVEHSMKNFYEIKKLPKNSDLCVVGYFSIIEALITHEPRLNENLDSIGHQVRNKIILLKKKFNRKIIEGNYFLHATENKIWQQLYSYRSCVAHGNIPDFNSKFQVLKNRNIVNKFLRETIKELLILALEDPEFFEDIKNC